MPQDEERVPSKLDDVAVVGVDHRDETIEELVEVEGEAFDAHVAALLEEVLSERSESGNVHKHDSGREGFAEGFSRRLSRGE